MNVVTSKIIQDGCEFDKRVTFYLSNFEFQVIGAVLRCLAIPYPIDTPSGERAEHARQVLLAELPASINRSLLMVCDEVCKAM